MLTYAIILGAGNGSRYGSGTPKQFLLIGGKMVIEWSVDVFGRSNLVDKIIVVAHPAFVSTVASRLQGHRKVSSVIAGGPTRRDSARRAIQTIEDRDARVLIHDAVRPVVTDGVIRRVVEALESHSAVYPVVPLIDTVVHVDAYGMVAGIPRRSELASGQTPQGFRLGVIRAAHELALSDPEVDRDVTNDCGLVVRYGLSDVKTVAGDVRNIKLTYQEQYDVIRLLLEKREQASTETARSSGEE